MSVFCKGCRKTKDNEEFGLEADGNQYKTCMKCRERKQKKSEEDEITCCDAEEIRNTFKQLNGRIAYLNEPNNMLNLDTDIARAIV